MIFFLPRVSLAATHCLKPETILKSWPKVKVCLLSNSFWVISSKIEKLPIILVALIFLIDMVELVNLITLVNSVELVKLVGLVDLIELVKLIGLINWFFIFEPKFLVRLALIEVCILALGISFGGSFCCMSLIASSYEHWNFSSFCQLAKLLFFRGFFSLNTTFSSI